MATKTRWMLAGASLLLASGCGARPSTPSASDREAERPTLVGHWSTSTDPQQAATATTMKFLASGEWHGTAPFELAGKLITAKTDGKDEIVTIRTSGSWQLDDDQLTIEVSQSTPPAINFSEPLQFAVAERTDEKLVLKPKKGERIILFRLPAGEK